MKWSFASVGLIVLGLVGIVIILLFEQITTSNESDYYLLKEITEAAMLDAIDVSYYRETGDLKIVKEKFVENFTRRFAESTLLSGTGYTINFYNIMETPPKVTVVINTGLSEFKIYKDTASFDIQNVLSGILEYTGENTSLPPGSNPYVGEEYSKTYYSMPSGDGSGNYGIVKEPINIPEKLQKSNIKNVIIKNISFSGIVEEQDELLFAKLNREIDWANATALPNRTDFSTSIGKYVNEMHDVEIKYYNCDAAGVEKGELEGISEEDCQKHKHWVYWKGKSDDAGKEYAALKLNITWKYEEYKY